MTLICTFSLSFSSYDDNLLISLLEWLADFFFFALSLFFPFLDFDLEKEKSLLDELGLKIAENQENSQKNRRKLAESTRGT